MSRFYANIQGSRGEATRQGTKSSGIYGHIRGWNCGARVSCEVDENDNDVVWVYATGGSNGYSRSSQLVARITDTSVAVFDQYANEYIKQLQAFIDEVFDTGMPVGCLAEDDFYQRYDEWQDLKNEYQPD